MNTSFRKMSNRLKKSVIELEKMALSDIESTQITLKSLRTISS